MQATSIFYTIARAAVLCLMLVLTLRVSPADAQNIFVGAEVRCSGTYEYVYVWWYNNSPLTGQYSLERNWQGGSPGEYLIAPWSTATSYGDGDSEIFILEDFWYHVEEKAADHPGTGQSGDSNLVHVTSDYCEQMGNVFDMDVPAEPEAGQAMSISIPLADVMQSASHGSKADRK